MLFVLDDVVAREPRPRRHAAVDDHERILLQRIRRRLIRPTRTSKSFFFLLRMFHLYHLTLIVGNLFLRFFKCHTAPLLDVLPQDMPFRTA